MRRDPLGDEGHELLGVAPAPSRRRTPWGSRRLPRPGTRMTAASATAGWASSTRLQLGRRHLEALVLDQLLDPVDDEDVAVVVDVADVAGVQPAVRRRSSPRWPRAVQVAAHHLRAADPQLAWLRRAERPRRSPGRRSGTRCWAAAGPTEPGRGPVAVGDAWRHRAGLGQAVPLDDRGSRAARRRLAAGRRPAARRRDTIELSADRS